MAASPATPQPRITGTIRVTHDNLSDDQLVRLWALAFIHQWWPALSAHDARLTAQWLVEGSKP